VGVRWARGLAVAVAVALFGGCAGSGSLRTPPQTDDAGITRLVSLRLATDARLCRYDVTAVVYNRTARLEGKVSDDADRRRAENVALEAGALRVDDQLRMDPATGDPGRC
jgi:osmotically-inducible protein OsmY